MGNSWSVVFNVVLGVGSILPRRTASCTTSGWPPCRRGRLRGRGPSGQLAQSHGDPAQQQDAGGPMGIFNVGDGPLPGADAFEEIAGMAAGVVDVLAAQAGRLAGDLRGIGVELVAMHDDLALGADEAPAAVFVFVAGRLHP